jgi:hypothetical protein
VLHPSQFHVNEAWIAFKLNDALMSTGRDGGFNLIALMDAASCFLLGNVLVPTSATEANKLDVKRLLKEAMAHKNELPKTLFIPVGQSSQNLAEEAARQGIDVVRVPEDQLLAFIGEARDAFKEKLGDHRTQ